MQKLDKLPKSMAGFIVGGLIAAGVALLYAPKSGEQTRRDIQENAARAKRKASMAIEDARGRVLNAAAEVQGKARQMIDSVGYEARHKAGRLQEVGSNLVNEQRISLERGVDDALDVMKS